MPDRPACNRHIGQNLRRARTDHVPGSLSQDDVARVLGITKAAVSHIERGTRKLRLDQAIVLDERLGITLDRLADGTPIDF
jgi:transcriptional regulator with XRE-family HTH domain